MKHPMEGIFRRRSPVASVPRPARRPLQPSAPTCRPCANSPLDLFPLITL